jgi:soluble epoxide hydrolase/lipid-phosphate phosphatase
LLKPAPTANTLKDGGWFGGADQPDKNWKHIPASILSIDEETFTELVEAMKKTTFWGADAWYCDVEHGQQ